MIRHHTQINNRPADSMVEVELPDVLIGEDYMTVRFQFRAIENGDGCEEFSRGWWEAEFVSAWIVDDRGAKVRDLAGREIDDADLDRATTKAEDRMF